MEINNLLKYIEDKQNVYLYGAGKFSREIIALCHRNEIEIKGILVSDSSQNPIEMMGVRVIGLNEVGNIDAYKINLIVAITGNLLEIKNALITYDFESVYYLPGNLYRIIQRWNALETYEEKTGQYYLEQKNNYIEPNNTIICEKDTAKRLCRVEWIEISRCPRFFAEECSYKELENEYGDIYYIPHDAKKFTPISSKLQNDNRIELYAVTSHLDNAVPEEIEQEGFIPIQVGAALTDKRKHCIGDDSGKTISVRNRDYSECTALYWLWENTSGQRYIGLNHYRRRLSLNDDSINYIISENLDLVTAIPHFSYEILSEYFQRFITKQDWNLMKKYCIEYDAEYEPCINIYEKSHFFFPCNIAVFKRDVFDSYCKFAFYVTEKIYSYYNDKKWIRNDRYMGYIFENLENLFILRHKAILRKGYSDVMWIN